MTHSSGRVFIIILLWARALCFLVSRLTTVSLDIYQGRIQAFGKGVQNEVTLHFLVW